MMQSLRAATVSLGLALSLAACTSNPYAAPSDVEGAPASATKLPSGLAYRVLKSGSGTVHPSLSDTVVVNYIGWTTDGKKFDSTYNTDGSSTPATFPLGRLIKGWQEAIPLMVMGEKLRIWIPAEMAYGEHPVRAGAPAGNLVFDVELVVIKPGS